MEPRERYLAGFDSSKLPKERTDLLVIGAGLAGLQTALTAASHGKQVLVLSKPNSKKASSFKAQGGIACALGGNDSPKLHAIDTIKAGRGLCDVKAVNLLVKEGKERVLELIDSGLEFDKASGGIVFGREGGHSRKRILHLGGDQSGAKLMDFMAKRCKENKGIQLVKAHCIDLLTKKNNCFGALIEAGGEKRLVFADSVALATGGYSDIYSNSTNSGGSFGEGAAMACRAGAKLMDMEFEQFHPTLLAAGGRNHMVTEAVRGEGALVLDSDGKRFLKNLDGRELAPRDVVSQRIFREQMKGKKVFLDCRHLDKKFFRKRFPSFTEKLSVLRMDPKKDLIPIAPAAHYSVGGVAADLNGRTNIKSLYAVGEASCTRVHGANRLASNSLLEAIVFGWRAGNDSVKAKKANGAKIVSRTKAKASKEESGFSGKKKGLQKIVWGGLGIVRVPGEMKKVLKYAASERSQAKFIESTGFREYYSMLEVASLVAESALRRKESRGVHYRKDFPVVREQFKRHSTVK